MKKIVMMKWWLYLCSACLCGTAFGQEVYEVNRTVTKSFAWTPKSQLELDNKYGDVIFETWDKDSIRVQVEISITSKKEEATQELADMAIVEVYGQGSFVIARTDWAANTSIWGQARNEMRNVFGSDQKVEISYKVWLPKTTPIDVTNKFGDVFIPTYDGEVILDLSHGDLRSVRISRPKSVSVQYGDAKVDSWGPGNLKLLFAELHSDEMKQLKIESKSSKLYVGKIDVLDIESRNDELYLKEVGAMYGSYHFTDTYIDLLTGSVNVIQNYGELEISAFGPKYTTVLVKAKRCKILFRLDEKIPVNFDITLTYGERFASVPELITITDDQELDDTRKLGGYWSALGSAKSIKVEGEKCVVEIAKMK
jgi:hypothetical protein